MEVDGLEGLNGLDMGDINIAELDTRTFHQPADPEVVASLPIVAMKTAGECVLRAKRAVGGRGQYS